ncbi:MAG: leucine-rich repeat protein [Corallococcus sp.]|nr:leucine-rich repeat protein [Corallococcus sp.]
MKKNINKIYIALLCLCLALSVVCVSACQPEGETITVTVDLETQLTEIISFTAEKGEAILDKLKQYQPADGTFVFGGWFIGEEEVTVSTRAEKDVTVKARYLADYTVEYYLENSDGAFVKSDKLTVQAQGIADSTATAERKSITGYVFDETNAKNVDSAVLSQTGIVLKLYYKRASVTLTFDKSIASASGSMQSITGLYGDKTDFPQCGFISDYDFVGWNTAADGSGDEYVSGKITLTSDQTLYAEWRRDYTEQVYVEQTDGSFALVSSLTKQGIIGHRAVSTASAPENYYIFDPSVAGCVTEGVVAEDEQLVLKSYFVLQTYTVAYMDDNASVNVKYGSKHTVRTPTDPSIVSYSTSSSGDGREYSFGSEFTVTGDVMLYPVIIDIYEDDDGSGDTVKVRRNMTGRGSVTLQKSDGKSYEGFIVINESGMFFDVTAENAELHGKLLDDNKFVYRNEQEYGTYFYFDPIFPEDGAIEYIMLALDGYGSGVYSMPANDGSQRLLNYSCAYERTENGDYYMQYFLPSNPTVIYEDWFVFVRHSYEEYPQMSGYFEICGLERDVYTLLYNRKLSENFIQLDGYGNAEMFTLGDGDQKLNVVKGIYYASESYTDLQTEFVFAPQDISVDPLLFVITVMETTNGKLPIYLIKRGEYGAYTANESAAYPELYLDGYGGAAYKSSADDEERVAYYSVIDDGNGGFTILVEFIDEVGGKMQVALNGTLFVPMGNFVIENSVLIDYIGEDSIISVPKGVTEIAANVFKDKNITTLTLPDTITKIGNYAFQNSAGSTGQSVLKTVYISAEVPPVLGKGVFRWPNGTMKIFVPDGCEDAYRTAESWSEYAQYVTSVAEENNKPLFEVKDGVLVSYNNKEEEPSDVAIVLPEEVTSIAKGVFANREYIVSVDLNNVAEIGDSAFFGCTNLAQVKFGANTRSIGKEAFYRCAFTQVDLGGVQTIGESAFNSCYSLTKVVIGNSLQSIGTMAFYRCGVHLDEVQEVASLDDLVIELGGDTAPQMAINVFVPSQPRIYVKSYEVGVQFANNQSWPAYATALRVKNSGDETTLYAKSNYGATLVLGDRATFDNGSHVGLYKFQDGYLYIAWLNYDSYLHKLEVVEQRASQNSSGEYVGFNLAEQSFRFVKSGANITYTSKDGETLTLTFGSSNATFCGNEVTAEVVNYRLQFTYDGYIYEPTLSNDNTFTFKRSKIVEEKIYTSLDGSELTVRFGDTVSANGRLKAIDGREMYTETWSWSLNKVSDGVYTWTIYYLSSTYKVTAVLGEGTFTYTWSVNTQTVVCDNTDGDRAVLTLSSDGEVKSIRILFKTANGSLECAAKFTSNGNGAYTVVIDETVDIVDNDGNVVGKEPSEFNGSYLMTVNLDSQTFTLTKQI